MKTVIVTDPDQREHEVPEADAEHFAAKEGWSIKGQATNGDKPKKTNKTK